VTGKTFSMITSSIAEQETTDHNTMAAAATRPLSRVLLINQENIPHYRISVYNYLGNYLKREGFALTVASDGVQKGSAHAIEFDHRAMPLSSFSLAKLIFSLKPDVIIFWVRLRHLYLFPILFLARLLGTKTIYWGHGTDLSNQKGMWFKRFLNNAEYKIFDALVLYGEHLKKNVEARFYPKTYIANNTLAFGAGTGVVADKARVLARYGIPTKKNIICCGRMQRRKKLEDLFAAFELLNRPDTGLILVGPDSDGVLTDIHGKNIHILGPIYGDERFELLAASDVFCLPGAVGLSIVDAFHCGLPFVTEAGDESPEIMYLKDGVNGFEVPRSEVRELAAKLELLLDDDALRQRFSNAARKEINTNGHMDRLCEGFTAALRSVQTGQLAGETAVRSSGR